jgi:hypothetical protein
VYFVPWELEQEGYPSQWVMLLFCKAQSIVGSDVGESSLLLNLFNNHISKIRPPLWSTRQIPGYRSRGPGSIHGDTRFSEN